jgi:beta-lactamase superfamily II metal-dependent hydrolase
MLVDSATERQCTKTVISFLNDHGITRLDYYVATHPHGDHVGGRSALRNEGIVRGNTTTWDWKTRDYGDDFSLEGTQWFISNAHDKGFHGSDANDNSLAFRLEYRGFVYSHGGDEGADSQRRFLQDRAGLVPAHVRNTAHHMYGAVSESFLRRTDADLYIISNSDRSWSRLPSAFRNAVSRNETLITGDDGVGHVVIRASSGNNWSHAVCGGKNSRCARDYIP